MIDVPAPFPEIEKISLGIHINLSLVSFVDTTILTISDIFIGISFVLYFVNKKEINNYLEERTVIRANRHKEVLLVYLYIGKLYGNQINTSNQTNQTKVRNE